MTGMHERRLLVECKSYLSTFDYFSCSKCAFGQSAIKGFSSTTRSGNKKKSSTAEEIMGVDFHSIEETVPTKKCKTKRSILESNTKRLTKRGGEKV